MTKPGKDEKPKAVELSPAHFELFEQRQNVFKAVAPSGCKPEDLDMNPRVLALNANTVRRGDLIWVTDPEETWLAELLVVQANGIGAMASLLRHGETPKAADISGTTVPEGYAVRPCRPNDPVPTGFIAYRVKDGVELNAQAPAPNELEAIAFLRNHAAVRGQLPQGMFR